MVVIPPIPPLTRWATPWRGSAAYTPALSTAWHPDRASAESNHWGE